MSATAVGAGPAAEAPSQAAVLAQMGRENFPVALRVLPVGIRRGLTAIYGFARLVDDIGDEAAGDREELLDWLEGDLDRAFAGRPPEHPVLRSLAAELSVRPLPVEPFRRLIEANRRDQVVTRYETFQDLLDYCRLSAAPVGELVLHVFDAATPGRIELSDRVCAGLQVLEHLQDIREDHGRGRIYMPARDMARFECREEDLGAALAADHVRALISLEVDRARRLLSAGGPLARSLRPAGRLAVAAFVAGGRAGLSAIERAGYDTLAGGARASRRSFVIEWARGIGGR